MSKESRCNLLTQGKLGTDTSSKPSPSSCFCCLRSKSSRLVKSASSTLSDNLSLSSQLVKIRCDRVECKDLQLLQAMIS